VVVIHHPEDLLVADQLSPGTTTARAPRTRPFHEVLHQEVAAEAVDHNEEEDSHVDPVEVAEVAEAAGGKKRVK
jgi:hypothetical protein